MVSEGAGPLSPPHSISDSQTVNPGCGGVGRGRGILPSISGPFSFQVPPWGQSLPSEPRRPPTVVSHVLCSPGPLTSVEKGEGHTRADLFSTSPVPLRLSPAEPEMDTKSRVVWVAGNSTKFSKTVAGGGPAWSEPNPAPSGLDL